MMHHGPLRTGGQFRFAASSLVDWLYVHLSSDRVDDALLREVRGAHAADMVTLALSSDFSLVASAATDGTLRVRSNRFRSPRP